MEKKLAKDLRKRDIFKFKHDNSELNIYSNELYIAAKYYTSTTDRQVFLINVSTGEFKLQNDSHEIKNLEIEIIKDHGN